MYINSINSKSGPQLQNGRRCVVADAVPLPQQPASTSWTSTYSTAGVCCGVCLNSCDQSACSGSRKIDGEGKNSIAVR